MGNTQEICAGGDFTPILSRQSSVETEYEEFETEPDYEEVLHSIDIPWMRGLIKQLLSQFLNTPFAGCSELLYTKRAEAHMQINIQHASNDSEHRFDIQYLEDFRETWYRFDPEHTGTILFKDVVSLIKALHQHFRCSSWAYHPSWYLDICRSFPNTVVTYLEFCLWAEHGEVYFPVRSDGYWRVNFQMENHPDDLEDEVSWWTENRCMHSTCYAHGEKYCDSLRQKTTLEMLMAAFLDLDKKLLTVQEIREYAEMKPSYQKGGHVDEALNDLRRRVEHKSHTLVLLADTREHPEYLSLYDFCINLYRPAAYSPVRRTKSQLKCASPVQVVMKEKDI